MNYPKKLDVMELGQKKSVQKIFYSFWQIIIIIFVFVFFISPKIYKKKKQTNEKQNIKCILLTLTQLVMH